jgi:hypothetical protein
MVGKHCAGPKGGGSASGLSEYLVGYAISGKGSAKNEIQAALDEVYLEAEARADLGVGRIWSPTAGHGTRPSSILIKNCSSFSTASLEMDADAASNGAVKHAALHFVWSFSTGESDHLTDEKAHRYVGEVLDKIGLGHHRQQFVVHRDTLVRSPSGKVIDGNLHVHAAVGSVDPRTGVAYPMVGIYRKMAWAEREVELAHGLEHDRGLATIQYPHTTRAFVRAATVEELAAWRRERTEERLVALERRSFDGYAAHDRDFGRYTDVTVGPRLQTAMDLVRQRGRRPDWATLHGVAARYGCALDADDGHVRLRDVGIGEMRIAHEKARRAQRKEMGAAGAMHDEIDDSLAAMKAVHEKLEAAERDRKLRDGEAVALDAVLRDERSDMPAFETVEDAEEALAALVERCPEMVLRDITAQSSTLDRSDVERWFSSRISDPDQMERLGDLVVAHDSVRLLEADTEYPLFTTTEILDIENHLHGDAMTLAHRESAFTSQKIERAIRAFEDEHQKAGDAFRLSDEQRVALSNLERGCLTTLEGLPGSGKTMIMSAVRVLSTLHGFPIVGLTLSQAAAERLEHEAGFDCVNTSRAAIMEDCGAEIIPRGGIVVVDEAGMVDSRAFARIVATAKERRAHVVAIGDRRQLQPIDAGGAWRIVTDVARKVDAYAELRDIQRQRRKWHRDAVAQLADAIVERHDGKRLDLVKSALRLLYENGAITWTETRDAAIDAAVTKVRAFERAGFCDVLMPAADKDTVRHLAEEHRRREGRQGVGRTYLTENGRRELVVGDRFMFQQNSLGKRGLQVRNGDCGEVVEALQDRIAVRLDRDNGRVVTFSPRTYKTWDWAVSQSVHKAQGASVSACVPLIDRSASAELVFVAVSRSKVALDIVVPKTAFADLEDFAEHVASRISLKTTSRTYDELLDRTGGKDTVRVHKIDRQREAESAPLRREWQTEVVEPLRELRAKQMRELRAAYANHGAADARDDSRSLLDRLERGRESTRTFRKAIILIHTATKPPAFSAWLKEREQDEVRVRARQRDRQRDRLTERAFSIKDRDRSRQHDRDDAEMSHELER